jgi:hypothetical protein
MAQADAAVPTDLQQLSERFEHWRRTRPGKSPIPEPLWAAAAQLARSHGVCQTEQVLRLEYKKLKQLMEAEQASARVRRRRAPAPAAFMEQVAPQPTAAAECLIESDTPRKAGGLMSDRRPLAGTSLAAEADATWECQWLLKLQTFGLLNNSFQPTNEIRIARTLWRQRGNLVPRLAARFSACRRR